MASVMKEYDEVCGAVRKGDFMVGSLAAAAKAMAGGITSVDTSALKPISLLFPLFWSTFEHTMLQHLY